MKNTDVRQYAKSRSIYLWQIAEALGISEPTMTRRMRTELPEQDKQTLFQIIDNLAEQSHTTEERRAV